MLVDEVQIKVIAGRGGDGKVNFHREKFVPKGGPDGGDGGNGGDVYFVGVEDISALNKFRFQKEFTAEKGKPGDKNRKTGASGKDLEIKVPVGTVITDEGGSGLPAGKAGKWEVRTVGERILIAKGGKGGRGNWHFKSATHQTPLEYEEGGPGQVRNLFLELQLIADIGFIGLPNVGKTSLLNELTAALAKVAAYPFTTLEPNLGAMDGLVLADLPGLIEGASKGKGLGIKFLRHIKRTKVLVHCVAADTVDSSKDYETVRKELSEYDKELLERPEIVLLTKSDLVSEKQLEDIKGRLKDVKGEVKGKEVLDCSIYDWDSLELLKKKLNNLIKA